MVNSVGKSVIADCLIALDIQNLFNRKKPVTL